MEGQDGVKPSQSRLEDIGKLANLSLSSIGEGGAETSVVAEDAN